METISIEQLSYPIGKFNFKADTDENQIKQWISEIEKLPAQLRNAVNGLNDTQLDTPYRDGGWTVRQVAHHLADSHMHAYIRTKLALTEDKPNIKPYAEKLWAALYDSKNLPVEISISLLESLHTRWTYTLKSLSATELNKTVFHPESKREMSVKFFLALYSWHGNHHCAHITELRKRKKWVP